MLWIKDGRTRDEPASRYWVMLGGGWSLVDPGSVVIVPSADRTIVSLTIDGALLKAVYSNGAVDVLTLPATPGGGGSTGIAVDTDGRRYFAAGGTAAVAVDTDGRHYFSGV